MRTAILMLFCCVSACQTSTPKQNEPPKKAESVPASKPSAVLEPASKEVGPTERRLYASNVAASSFLLQDEEIPRDRYHPNYAMDSDPLTAWNEGSSSSGVKEWLQIPLTETTGVSGVRLRILNGYQKSPSLYEANARVKKAEVILLPNKKTFTLNFEDKMDVQEFSFETKDETVNAIMFTVTEVYEGGKYKDLCISEVEVFATAKNPGDAAAEKQKLDALLEWKSNQLAMLELIKTGPVFPKYTVADSALRLERVAGRSVFAAAATVLPAAAQEYLDRAEESADEERWKAVSVDFSAMKLSPPTEGMGEPCGPPPVIEYDPDMGGYQGVTQYSGSYGLDLLTFTLPCGERGPMLLTEGVNITKLPKPDGEAAGLAYWINRDHKASGLLRELIVDFTIEESSPTDSREGGSEESYTHYKQILEYDEKGRLRLLVDDSAVIYWFEWKTIKGRQVITSGISISAAGGITQLYEVGAAPPQLSIAPTSSPASAPTSAATTKPTNN